MSGPYILRIDFRKFFPGGIIPEKYKHPLTAAQRRRRAEIEKRIRDMLRHQKTEEARKC